MASYSSLPPAPFAVEYLEEYLVVFKQLAYLLDVAETSDSDFEDFLAVAEYRYTLYLDLLAKQSNGEKLILPPWDVAIIWHAHLRFPFVYLADVIHRPAYSQVPGGHLDFPTKALADLVKRELWSDAASQAVWQSSYSGVRYQLWPDTPVKESFGKPLELHNVLIRCTNDVCAVQVSLTPLQLRHLRKEEDPALCLDCGTSFSKHDVFYANLRRDWRTLLTSDDQESVTAIKGAVLDDKGQLIYSEASSRCMRKWAKQCTLDARNGKLAGIDAAVEQLRIHLDRPSDYFIPTLEKSVSMAYKSHIWPNLSGYIAGFIKKHQDQDRRTISCPWTTNNEILPRVLERYVRYLQLRGTGWDLFLHPDVKLARDAHRLVPSLYHRYCEDNVGERLCAGPGSQNDQHCQTDQILRRTKTLWEAEYREPYDPLVDNPACDDSEANALACLAMGHLCITCCQQHEDNLSPLDAYSSLYTTPLKGAEFRLFTFLYKCSAGVLHYDLKKYSLEDSPSYMATSYTWESPYLRADNGEIDDDLAGEELVCCNNTLLSVTSNAHALLTTLRICEANTSFWMDCICINQRNEKEKSEQVLRMNTIYSNAACVIIWLGPNHAFMQDFRWACTTFLIRHKQTGRAIGDREKVPMIEDSQFWDAAGLPNAQQRWQNASIFAALCRWFNRTWVVQEAVLAQQITVLVGRIQIPWHDDICWLGKSYSSVTGLAPNLSLPEAMQMSPSIGHRAWQIQARRGRLVQPDTQYEAATTDESRFILQLLEMINTFRDTDCSDDRDKVYAMLGIASSKLNIPSAKVSSLVPVDYERLDAKEVYYLFAKAAVENLETLHILNYVQDNSPDDETELPSWVPDFSWSMHTTMIHHRAKLRDPFLLWQNFALDVERPRVEGLELWLHGIKIDSISARLPTQQGAMPVLNWLELCAHAITRSTSSTRIDGLISAVIMRDIKRE